VFISFISFVISIVNRQNLLVFLLFPGFSVAFLQKRGFSRGRSWEFSVKRLESHMKALYNE